MARPSRQSVPIENANPLKQVCRVDDESVQWSYSSVVNSWFAERKFFNIAAGIRKHIMKFGLDEDDVILAVFCF